MLTKSYTYIIVLLMYWGGGVSAQHPAIKYASGRLLLDPDTKQPINSPYLQLSINDQQRWLFYDPKVKEGRFYALSSTASGPVVGGYFQGEISLGDKTLQSYEHKSTAIVASFNMLGEPLWTYTYPSRLRQSVFTAIVKLSDASTVVSGFSYFLGPEGQQKRPMAILSKFNKEGELLWEHKVPSSKGYKIKNNGKEDLVWQLITLEEDETTLTFQTINHHTGEPEHIFKDERNIVSKEDKGNLDFTFDDNESFVSVTHLEKEGVIRLAKYSIDGDLQWFSHTPMSEGFMQPTGITRTHEGFEVAANLYNKSSSGEDKVPESRIIILSFDNQGIYKKHRIFGEDWVNVNGLCQSEGRLGIFGTHLGALKINQLVQEDQDSLDLGQAYSVWLDEGVPIRDLRDITKDSIITAGNLKVFPNPVTDDILYLSHQEVIKTLRYDVQVYDLTGRLVAQKVNSTSKSELRDFLRVDHLPDGVYHLYFDQRGKAPNKAKFVIKR